MKTRFIFLLLMAAMLYSCASYKDKQQTNALTFPELGSIIKTKGALWYSATEQVGAPNWAKELSVNVQQLPFNPKSYNTYAQVLAKAGKINGVAYNDSLPYKPKYIRLQLADKIALTSVLNSDTNKAVLNYLENDADYKLVSTIHFTAPESQLASFEQADNVLLKQDAFKKIQLVLLKNGKEELVDFSSLQVFDFEYASFCWGEDRYHHKQIENIVAAGDKCPKGTYLKPNKIKTDKTYLKF